MSFIFECPVTLYRNKELYVKCSIASFSEHNKQMSENKEKTESLVDHDGMTESMLHLFFS